SVMNLIAPLSGLVPGLLRFFVFLQAAWSTTGASRADDEAPRYSVKEIPYGTTFAGLPAGSVIVGGMNNKRQVVGNYRYNDTAGLSIYLLWLYLPEPDYGRAAGFHLVSMPGKG